MSPLVSEFFRSRYSDFECSFLLPNYFHSHLLSVSILLSSVSLSLTPLSPYHTTCLCRVVFWLRLLWLGTVSPLALAAAACVATLLQPLPSIIYTRAHTYSQRHKAGATHSIHRPGATPDFKLQLAEPEAKLNLKGSSVEVTQTGNNCLSHSVCVCVFRRF